MSTFYFFHIVVKCSLLDSIKASLIGGMPTRLPSFHRYVQGSLIKAEQVSSYQKKESIKSGFTYESHQNQHLQTE